MIIRVVFLSLIFYSLSFAKLSILVSILPQKMFVEKIGGKFVNVNAIVKQGSSPHTYEPKSSDMKMLANSDIYFSIGVDFEKRWLYRFDLINKKIVLVQLDKKIDTKNKNDPHIWMDPNNVLIMAKTIYDTLCLLDSKNMPYYNQRYKKFINEIKNIDLIIKDNLKKSKKIFISLHPSFGYFADRYGLKQISIKESNGGIKIRQLIKIIKLAKKYKLSYIISSLEFSNDRLNHIIKDSNIKIIFISALNKKWFKNLIHLSKIVGR